jgi:hypothetical protein
MHNKFIARTTQRKERIQHTCKVRIQHTCLVFFHWRTYFRCPPDIFIERLARPAMRSWWCAQGSWCEATGPNSCRPILEGQTRVPVRVRLVLDIQWLVLNAVGPALTESQKMHLVEERQKIWFLYPRRVSV